MGPNHPAIPRAADANHSRTFDPWNSVGAGHQRAEGRAVGGWREARDLKLRGQFAAGHAGGGGAAAAARRGNTSLAGFGQVRAKPGNTIADLLRMQGGAGQRNGTGGSNTASVPADPPSCRVTQSANAGAAHAAHSGPDAPRGPTTHSSSGCGDNSTGRETVASEEKLTAARAAEDERQRKDKETARRGRRILDGLVVYVNGSTHPAISDHRLKRVLVENGARVALHLARRQVTHVILGRPARAGGGAGAGGGLAGGKLEREIRRVGGCGVKYVGVEWYVLLEALLFPCRTSPS